MNKTKIWNIDLNTTLLWWQSFQWDKIWDYYYWFTNSKLIKLKKQWLYLIWQTFNEKWISSNDKEFINEYFRLNLNYESIIDKINKDKIINAAIKSNYWLRLLKQDLDQCLLSFIASSSNSIQNIRNSIRNMNKALWKKLKVDWLDFYLFPTTEIIAKQSEDKIKEFKFWFRSKYILACAKKLIIDEKSKLIQNNFDENKCRSMLKEFSWVWDKIADCVLSFSLCFDNVSPVDTWIKKILHQYYNIDENTDIIEVRKWFNEYFESHANFAWQFLFEHYRK